MDNDSFSAGVKKSVSDIVPKRGCCRKTAKMTEEALSYPEDFRKAEECADRFLCDECGAVFLRICFIKYGTVTDPSKSYHLEMSFPDERFRDVCAKVIEDQGMSPKLGTRRDHYTVYFKSSESIGDFLAHIGASNAYFELINLKLMKEATISINRQNNFETANLQKTVNANRAYVAAIEHLMSSGNFDSLTDDLRETAKLRMENDTASMSELGRLHSPSISKSGVKHRLDKLVQISENIKNRR